MSTELALLLQRLVTHEGVMASPVPGLWFFRSDHPTAPSRNQASSLYAVLPAQGRKLARTEHAHVHYDPEHCFVMLGEGEYESQILQAPYLAVGMELPAQLIVELMLQLEDLPEEGPVHEILAVPLHRALDEAVKRLVRSVEDPDDRRILAPMAQREVAYHLLRSEAASTLRRGLRQAEREPIRTAMAFMAEHADQRLTVGEVARQVAMSPSHFAHRFRSVARTSPMQYLKHLRLMRARALLLAEGLRPSEVAPKVGYASLSHFHRDFKRQFGVAPARYARAFEGHPVILVDP